jgi:hypothetical protein
VDEDAVLGREVAKDLGFEWPVAPPSVPLPEMGVVVQRALEQAVDAEYPMQILEDYAKQTRAEYDMWEVGEDVEFQIRGGQGVNPVARGKLEEIHPMRVRVGGRWVIRDDMPEEAINRIYEADAEEEIERLIRVRRVRLEGDRRRYREAIEAEVTAEIFEESGYCLRDSVWVPRRSVWEAELAARRAELAVDEADGNAADSATGGAGNGDDQGTVPEPPPGLAPSPMAAPLSVGETPESGGGKGWFSYKWLALIGVAVAVVAGVLSFLKRR